MLRSHTHNTYTLKVKHVFRAEREGEASKYKGSALGNRQLLWHGSRLSNWVGILSQGLRIAPPEAPVTGYMFGKGSEARTRSNCTRLPFARGDPRCTRGDGVRARGARARGGGARAQPTAFAADVRPAFWLCCRSASTSRI